MKHSYLLFITIAFAAILAKAKDPSETIYFTDGMEWRSEITGTQSPNATFSLETVTIEDYIDDVIFKMFRHYNNDTSYQEFIAFVKTIGDKVFFSSESSDDSDWYLLYGFGIMDGEGCYVYSPLVMSTSKIPYKTYIKCIGVNELTDSKDWTLMTLEEYNDDSCTELIGHGAWIKGLSSLNGVLYNNRFNVDGCSSQLLEVLENGNVLFSNSLSGISSMSDSSTPEIKNHGFEILVTTYHDIWGSLYNASGLHLGNYLFAEGTTSIKVANSGIYILKIDGTSRKILIP